MSAVTIEKFGLQGGTDKTVYVTWRWDKPNTLEYEVKWYYDAGNELWFVGSESTTDNKQSVYSAPENSVGVRVVIKPISEVHTVNNVETRYWVADWSTERVHYFVGDPPLVPPSPPTVEIKDFTLTARLENLNDINASHIDFQVFNDNAHIFSAGRSEIVTFHASYSCKVKAGSEYKVICRSYRDGMVSKWTDFSENQKTGPAAVPKIERCRATSDTSVLLVWPPIQTAESYEIEYTTDARYFTGSDETTTISNIETAQYEKTGLEPGEEYFFRVRAVNEKGESAWTEPVSVVLGEPPEIPTTWSSTTTCIVGEPLTLNWTHNSKDGSTQRYAEVELYLNDVKETYTIRSVDEEDDEKTMFYAVNTSGFVEGTKIKWRVRTAGVTNEYGEWSIQRYVDVYAPPTLTLSVTDADVNRIETLTSFPFYIRGQAGPDTQRPLSYHVSVISNKIYEISDTVGTIKMVNAGEEVYSKHFDTTDELLVEMSAENISLQNNISYTVKVTVSMDSGLTAEASSIFTVGWSGAQYEPNAEISIDRKSLSAYIRPYCLDDSGSPVEGVTLSVYRREFDGAYTEIASGLENSGYTFITDPHPALDYARYRVIAVDDTTGLVSYYDVPSYPVNEKAVVIQWDEAWSTFDTSSPDPLDQPSWAGSMLKLPYNIDVSDEYNMDVSLVEYIGRKRPVSYYGTQRRETGTWNVEIPKSDKNTLYALRRLALWTGDVYVREPSGSGYWANIAVSFSQKHLELVIPITIKVTRVEGGA